MTPAQLDALCFSYETAFTAKGRTVIGRVLAEYTLRTALEPAEIRRHVYNGRVYFIDDAGGLNYIPEVPVVAAPPKKAPVRKKGKAV